MPRKTWPAVFLFQVFLRCAGMDGRSQNAGKPNLKWFDVTSNSKNVILGDGNSGWSAWGSWSVCSENTCCRHGVALRHRNCRNEPCTGIESEAEDCPKTDCKECSPEPLAESAPALTSSFINMECETTRKYSASGAISLLIPRSLYQEFPVLKKVLRSGFFGIQNFLYPSADGKLRHRIMIYKFCFEPKLLLTSRQAQQVFESNRRFRLPYPKQDFGPSRVSAILITMLPNGKVFKPGIYFTVSGPNGLTSFYRQQKKEKKP